MNLPADVVALAAHLVDIPSVSGNEWEIADVVEETLRSLPHLEVLRDGDAVLARTNLGRDTRVILAGHLDTVPVDGNLPSTVTGTGDRIVVHGRGTCDMKGGLACMVWLAQRLTSPNRDITWVFYDCEEIEASANGLGRIAEDHPDWLAGDFAVLMEPTSDRIEGGADSA